MKCLNCGNEIGNAGLFCPTCGKALSQSTSQQPVNYAPPYTYAPPQPIVKQTNVLAIVGFILSFFMPLFGLIFSIIGDVKAKRLNSGKGLATAGITISVISIVITILFFSIIIAALITTPDYYDPTYYYYY